MHYAGVPGTGNAGNDRVTGILKIHPLILPLRSIFVGWIELK